jgi:hypothetical protein
MGKYIPSEKVNRRCVVCDDLFLTCHPTAKTCGHPDCKEKLKKDRFARWIKNQAAKLEEQEA